MSKLRLNETATGPSGTPAGKVDFSAAPNRGLRITDENGSTIYTPSIYGTDYNGDSEDSFATNNTTTFQNYLTVPYTITDINAAALYELEVSFIWGYSSGSTDYRGRLTINGSQYREIFSKEPKDGGSDQRDWRGFKYLVTGAELATLTGNVGFDFAASSNGNTARTYYAYLSLKRVK